jgi:hypothetical protein
VSLAAGNESSQAAKGPPVIKSEQLQKTDARPIPTPKRAQFAPPRPVDTKPTSSGPGLPFSHQIKVSEQQGKPRPDHGGGRWPDQQGI